MAGQHEFHIKLEQPGQAVPVSWLVRMMKIVDQRSIIDGVSGNEELPGRLIEGCAGRRVPRYMKDGEHVIPELDDVSLLQTTGDPRRFGVELRRVKASRPCACQWS